MYMVKKNHAHKGETCFLPKRLKVLFLSPAPRAGPSHVMFVRTSMDSGSQDATKIPCALTDSRIYSFTKMITLYMCIVKVTIFLSVSPSFSSSVVAMWTSRPAGLCRINRWTKNSAEQAGRFENYFYESLDFSRHSVDLDFNEEVMKPERFTETPDHAGVNPDTIRVSKWCRKTTLKGDVSHFSSFSRTSDTFVEINFTSEREPIEDDEERLAMKIGDMLLPLPGRVFQSEDSRRSSIERILLELGQDAPCYI